MAYTKHLKVLCDEPGCLKQAKVEVFNSRNASLGKFCQSDGHRRLILLLKIEADTAPHGEV